jgi:hypothetical protein
MELRGSRGALPSNLIKNYQERNHIRLPPRLRLLKLDDIGWPFGSFDNGVARDSYAMAGPQIFED